LSKRAGAGRLEGDFSSCARRLPRNDMVAARPLAAVRKRRRSSKRHLRITGKWNALWYGWAGDSSR
jgi:hypothetical protein